MFMIEALRVLFVEVLVGTKCCDGAQRSVGPLYGNTALHVALGDKVDMCFSSEAHEDDISFYLLLFEQCGGSSPMKLSSLILNPKKGRLFAKVGEGKGT